MESPKLPTPQIVQAYVEQFNKEQIIVERALAKLFGAFPENKSIDEVLLKVVTLNNLYATGILAPWYVADFIYGKNIDSKLRDGDIGLVEGIATVTIKGKTRRNYSFTSKYCAWHRPDIFPIYDGFVDGLLQDYQKIHKFSLFGRYDLWNSYPKFVQVIKDFQCYFRLNEFTIKQLDQFLWLYGKQFAEEKRISKESHTGLLSQTSGGTA